jgi:hypothetical protein
LSGCAIEENERIISTLPSTAEITDDDIVSFGSAPAAARAGGGLEMNQLSRFKQLLWYNLDEGEVFRRDHAQQSEVLHRRIPAAFSNDGGEKAK